MTALDSRDGYPTLLNFHSLASQGGYLSLVQTELLSPPDGREEVSRRTMARQRSKSELPTKICPVCQRPFTWRKKWADCWDEVKYCSERCRRRRSQASP